MSCYCPNHATEYWSIGDTDGNKPCLKSPLGPEKLLSAPPSFSLGLSKILPAEAEDAEGALQGMCTLIWLLIPWKAKNTEEHAALGQMTKKEKRSLPGEGICLPQLDQLP